MACAVPSATPPASATAQAMRLVGTVQREGVQVRVLLRAVDAAQGNAVWSGSFDGRADSLLALQGRVARTVANGLAAVVERDSTRP
jgi:TolB-like protein